MAIVTYTIQCALCLFGLAALGAKIAVSQTRALDAAQGSFLITCVLLLAGFIGVSRSARLTFHVFITAMTIVAGTLLINGALSHPIILESPLAGSLIYLFALSLLSHFSAQLATYKLARRSMRLPKGASKSVERRNFMLLFAAASIIAAAVLTFARRLDQGVGAPPLLDLFNHYAVVVLCFIAAMLFSTVFIKARRSFSA